MRCRTPIFLTLLLLFSFSLTSALDDDFSEFSDEEPVKVAEGANSHVVGSEDISEFDEEIEEVDAQVEEHLVEEDNAFDFDDEEDDGEVESIEDNDNTERDTFEDFADDQVIQTEPGEKHGHPSIKKAGKSKNKLNDKLKLNTVPDHLRPSWKAFWVEGILLSFIIYYIFNYFMGHKENENIAKALMSRYSPYLKEQFSQVGENNEGALTQQSHNNYTVWCTGRKGVEGMMIEINLVPRQDLITIWRNKFNRKRPQTLDTVTFSVYLDDNEPMEPVVLCLGKSRAVSDLWMQFSDLRTYCPKGPKDKSAILKGNIGCAESMEMLTFLFDERNKTAMQDKDGASLHYMHITDNCQPKEVDEAATDEAVDGEVKGKATKLIVVSVQIDNDDDMFAADTLPFLKGTIIILDKLRRMKLSKEVKSACEKRRTRAAEESEKKKHSERHANAAARKEDARRRLNRRIEEEEDPEKQRRLHDQLMKKDAKDRQKRMKGKQMKVK